MTVLWTALRGRGMDKIILSVLLGTSGCVCVSLFITYWFFRGFDLWVMQSALLLAFLLSVLLAMPLFFYTGIKLRQLSQANYLLKQAGRYDGLTRCLNRSAFTADVTAFIASQDGSFVPQRSAFLVLDADHFKTINDRFGHDTGDKTLMAIARCLRTAAGEGAMVGRLGGEEFAVFAPDVGAEGIFALAESLRAAVEGDVRIDALQGEPVTVSIGGVCFVYPAQYEDIFKIADEQLYLAKNAGRNCVSLIEHSRLAERMIDLFGGADTATRRQRRDARSRAISTKPLPG